MFPENDKKLCSLMGFSSLPLSDFLSLNCNNVTLFWLIPHRHNKILSVLKKEFIQNYLLFTWAKNNGGEVL